MCHVGLGQVSKHVCVSACVSQNRPIPFLGWMLKTASKPGLSCSFRFVSHVIWYVFLCYYSDFCVHALFSLLPLCYQYQSN